MGSDRGDGGGPGRGMARGRVNPRMTRYVPAVRAVAESERVLIVSKVPVGMWLSRRDCCALGHPTMGHH